MFQFQRYVVFQVLPWPTNVAFAFRSPKNVGFMALMWMTTGSAVVFTPLHLFARTLEQTIRRTSERMFGQTSR